MTKKQGTKPNAWTEAENALMRQHYQSKGIKYLTTVLNRSEKAISEQGAKLKLTRAFLWTAEEDEVLRQNYTANGASFVAAATGRTVISVRSRAAFLKVPADKSRAGRVRAEKQHAERKAREPVPIVLRKSAKKLPSGPKFVGEAIVTSKTKVTICPAGADARFKVDKAPRVIDSAECRDWAKAAA